MDPKDYDSEPSVTLASPESIELTPLHTRNSSNALSIRRSKVIAQTTSNLFIEKNTTDDGTIACSNPSAGYDRYSWLVAIAGFCAFATSAGNLLLLLHTRLH